MRLIKEKYNSIGKDFNMKIVLSSNNNLSGLQESINDFIETETELSINKVVDGETFRYKRNINKIFEFEFLDNIQQTYSNSLLNAGFTEDDINNKSDNITNSFYILQVFDSINRENQTLLHNSYYNGSEIISLDTTYTILIDNEFSNLYIPEWFIKSTDSNTIKVYANILFFNAKTGKIQLFYNTNKESLSTEDKMYQEILIDKTLMTYQFSDINNIKSKELNNTIYNDKFNKSINSFNNEIPQFPIGKLFNNDGKYTEIS